MLAEQYVSLDHVTVCFSIHQHSELQHDEEIVMQLCCESLSHVQTRPETIHQHVYPPETVVNFIKECKKAKRDTFQETYWDTKDFKFIQQNKWIKSKATQTKQIKEVTKYNECVKYTEKEFTDDEEVFPVAIFNITRHIITQPNYEYIHLDEVTCVLQPSWLSDEQWWCPELKQIATFPLDNEWSYMLCTYCTNTIHPFNDSFTSVKDRARSKIVKYIYDELPSLYDILEQKKFVDDVASYGDMHSKLTEDMLDIYGKYNSEE